MMKCCQFEALGNINKLLNDVGYGDDGGCHKLMDRICEIIAFSLHHPVLFALLDMKTHCGVILLGGKNAFIAHAVAHGLTLIPSFSTFRTSYPTWPEHPSPSFATPSKIM